MKRLKITAALVLLALATASGAAADDDGKAHLLETLTPVCQTHVPLSSDDVEYITGFCGTTGGHVAIEGNRLYMGSYGVGMKAFDISNRAAPQFIGEYTPGGPRADAVPDAIDFGGRRFAVLNGTSRVGVDNRVRTQRSEFLDMTSPATPKLLAHFIGATDGEAHNGDIVDERRLWLPSGGSGVNGLRIYDLTPTLTTPSGECAPAPVETGADKSDGSGNPCAPRKIYGSKAATPPSDPVGEGDPVLLWQNSPYRNGRPVGNAFTHTHDITVYTDYDVAGLGKRDIALLAEGGNYTNDAGNTGSVFVIDITNPRQPVVLLRWLHERGPSHHPIRYHHEAQFIDGDRHLMLVTDEDLHNTCAAGGVTAVRLSADLQSATELSEWFIGLGTPAAVCSVHVFSSEGNLAFFGSYNAGLQVVDYSNPAAPQKVGHYIAPGTTAWGAQYHEGYVYVGDMTRGLDVFKWVGPLPDLTLSSGDISFSPQKVVGGDRVTITATVRNAGGVGASNVGVRFYDNGVQIGGEQTITSIAANGGTGTASVVWNTKHLKGEHTITVTADPADRIDESNESNNSASRTVLVRGNKVQNGSFESSSSGSSPDAWSSSGSTSYQQGGSDGERSVAAGPGGSWTSAPVPVSAGASYGVSAAIAGTGTLLAEQLSPSGQVLATTSLPASGLVNAFAPVTGSLAAVPGAATVRVVLVGGLGGGTFDDVRLWEE
jgi:hypothetical protein